MKTSLPGPASPALQQRRGGRLDGRAPGGLANGAGSDVAPAARAADLRPPSKTRRKREMHRLQDIGEELLELNRDQFTRIALSAELDAARPITAHEARRRQLQYIGRLMRPLDPNALRQAIDHATGAAPASVALMQRCAQLREQLLADDRALTGLLGADVGLDAAADAQWLRAAIRAARRERAAGAAPRHARELYRWLYARLDAQANPVHAAGNGTDGDQDGAAGADGAGDRSAPVSALRSTPTSAAPSGKRR